MKVAGTGNNFSLVRCYTLDRISPFARRLDRGLDGLCAGVHRQGHVLAGQGTNALEKRAEPVRVKRARHDIQLCNLLLHQLDQPWMRMTVAYCRVSAHHVEVLVALVIPDMDAVCSGENHWQGLVVLGTVPCFEFDPASHSLVVAPYGSEMCESVILQQ